MKIKAQSLSLVGKRPFSNTITWNLICLVSDKNDKMFETYHSQSWFSFPPFFCLLCVNPELNTKHRRRTKRHISEIWNMSGSDARLCSPRQIVRHNNNSLAHNPQPQLSSRAVTQKIGKVRGLGFLYLKSLILNITNGDNTTTAVEMYKNAR